jgi:hypothetical protein
MSTKVHLHSDTLGQHVRRLLVVTQLVFFASLIACWIVAGGDRASTNGISFFGVYWPTLPIIALGYLSSSVGLWRTATYFQYLDQSKVVVFGLRYIALGLVGLLLLPYNVNGYFNFGHTILGVSGALTQVSMALVLLRPLHSWRGWLAFAIQIGGGLVAFAALPDWKFGYLLQGETIFQIGFGLCLIELTFQVKRFPYFPKLLKR